MTLAVSNCKEQQTLNVVCTEHIVHYTGVPWLITNHITLAVWIMNEWKISMDLERLTQWPDYNTTTLLLLLLLLVTLLLLLLLLLLNVLRYENQKWRNTCHSDHYGMHCYIVSFWIFKQPQLLLIIGLLARTPLLRHSSQWCLLMSNSSEHTGRKRNTKKVRTNACDTMTDNYGMYCYRESFYLSHYCMHCNRIVLTLPLV